MRVDARVFYGAEGDECKPYIAFKLMPTRTKEVDILRAAGFGSLDSQCAYTFLYDINNHECTYNEEHLGDPASYSVLQLIKFIPSIFNLLGSEELLDVDYEKDGERDTPRTLRDFGY